jgi:hypothetical protein
VFSNSLWFFLLLSASFAEPLPRVLILGDSVYTQPASEAAKMLRGRVEIVYASPGEARNTTMALASLDVLLGEGKWDLIHFNFGLGDLVYRAPGMKSFRVFPRESGGVRTTSPEQYEKNLRELVKRLKATGAKVIWASTTPIRSTPKGIFKMGSEVEYNAIAAKAMAEHDVTINDMYVHVKSLIDMKRPDRADPFSFEKKPLDPPVVRSILEELNLTRAVKGPVKVFVMVGGWAHIGGGIVLDPGKPKPGGPRGTLDDLVLNEKTAAAHRHLLDEDGNWTTRPDVWIQFDRRGPKSGTLGIGYGGDRKRGIGPELALGHVFGDHFDEQVCIVKTALGTPSVAKDLRPPSSGQAGKTYTLLLSQIKESMAKLADKFPDYTDETGYETAGLILNLGEQDTDAATYAEYLPKLITDLRKDLKTPNLPVVIVGTGQGGSDNTAFPEILKAQQAVATLPQFAGTVIYTESRDFWPPENARAAYRNPSVDRWYDNAESFYKIGKAAGEGMLKLLSLPKPVR